MQETRYHQNLSTNTAATPGAAALKGRLRKKFIFGIFVIIVPVLGFLFTWLSVKLYDQVRVEALSKARVVADQIILTRQWVTDCMGGVFVHRDSAGAQDVTYATPDRIVTPQGVYQFFTPSMVTKKLSQYSSRERAYQFRLTSLTPINADNRPDEFEATGLTLFGRGLQKEYFKFSDTRLDYMVPLQKRQGCIKCHSDPAIVKAGIIGGLRISIPFEQTRKAFRRNQMLLGLTGLVITLTTIGVLVFLVSHLILRPLGELENKSRQLSAGDLGSRVFLNTGDELERLGLNFNLMAQRLMHHRDDLELKVARATHDLARANHELMKLDKLKSDFLANMSHELRSPLTSVQGSIDYLKRTTSDRDSLAYLTIMEKNIARLTRMITNLFDFTKLEAGKIDWEFECQDLAQLVREVVEIMGPAAERKGVRLRAEVPDRAMAVIDLERMEQVLVNLIDNAVKFAPARSQVDVRMAETEAGYDISICDRGPGIAPENRQAIFQKFYTAETPAPPGESGPPSPKGAGMGLAISRAIVTAHNGEIAVACDNQTTSFSIHLPKETHGC